MKGRRTPGAAGIADATAVETAEDVAVEEAAGVDVAAGAVDARGAAAVGATAADMADTEGAGAGDTKLLFPQIHEDIEGLEGCERSRPFFCFTRRDPNPYFSAQRARQKWDTRRPPFERIRQGSRILERSKALLDAAFGAMRQVLSAVWFAGVTMPG